MPRPGRRLGPPEVWNVGCCSTHFRDCHLLYRLGDCGSTGFKPRPGAAIPPATWATGSAGLHFTSFRNSRLTAVERPQRPEKFSASTSHTGPQASGFIGFRDCPLTGLQSGLTGFQNCRLTALKRPPNPEKFRAFQQQHGPQASGCMAFEIAV